MTFRLRSGKKGLELRLHDLEATIMDVVWGKQLSSFAVGDVLGPELTVRTLLLPTGNQTGATSIGLAFTGQYADRRWSVRVPSAYTTLLPEMGLILRDGFAPAFYAAWSLPVSWRIDPRFALDVRLTGILIDDWVPGDDVAFVGLFTVGGIIPVSL